MSITAETAKAHANDPAVLCCRAEGGITIEPANLEDPAIFDELVDSGLLNLDGCLKIGQVLGAKLTKTSDSLCPLTADNVEGFKTDDELAAEEAPACDVSVCAAASVLSVLSEPHPASMPAAIVNDSNNAKILPVLFFIYLYSLFYIISTWNDCFWDPCNHGSYHRAG